MAGACACGQLSSHSNRFISCVSSRNTIIAPGTSISKQKILFLFFLMLTVTLNTVENNTDRSMKFQQRLELKREMHFSSHDCYMFSSVQVYVTSQTKQYLTSIDRLCLHVRHSFAFIYPFSPWVSLSLSLFSLKPPAVNVCSSGVKPSRWENIIALFFLFS